MKNRSAFTAIAFFCVFSILFLSSCSLFESVPYHNSEEMTVKDYYDEEDAKKDLLDFSNGAYPREPETKIGSNSAVATSYEPVYPLLIANEGAASPVELHSFVPEKLRTVYSVMVGGLKAGKNDIVFSKPIALDDMRRAVIYVRDLNPELFYVDWSAYTYTEGAKGVLNVHFDFLLSDISASKANFEQAVNYITAKANTLPNLFERELYVHDYLVNNTVYSVSADNGGSAYGALVEGTARCEGYARAFQVIMLRLGIPCFTSVGDADGERHMWNTVNLYGNYYNVDVTFDDDTKINGKTAYSEGEIRHSCFNVPDSIISVTHTLSQIGSLDRFGSYQNLFVPECSSLDFSYYRVRGFMITNLEQFKYLLSKNTYSKRVEIFFDGNMPSVSAFQSEFDRFFRDSGRTNGYSIYYSPEDSELYLRHVFELSWEDK